MIMERDCNGKTLLHCACHNENISLGVVEKLIEMGSIDILMAKDGVGETILHYACRNENSRLDIISKLIEVGGRELVMYKDQDGETALHFACRNNGDVRIDIVSKLVEAGGIELVMEKDVDDETALHYECRNGNTSLDIVSKLLEVGGHDLVMGKDGDGETYIHYYICRNENISLDVVSKLIEVGGRDLVMEKEHRYGSTALHVTCLNENISIDIVSKLIEVGGHDLVMEKDQDGDIALYYGYFMGEGYCCHIGDDDNGVFSFLMKECILANIGGEFGIGGLFNVARQEVQDNIYDNWEELLPALKFTMLEELFQAQQQPPILHAALLAKAPSHIIQSIICHFEYSILKTDSLGRYPIEVAFDKDLKWNEGLREVVEVTTTAQQYGGPSIYTAARYGLKWSNHMKELGEDNVDEVVDGYDSLTGLRLFMVAAMGDRHDLSGIYGLIRMSPNEKLNDD